MSREFVAEIAADRHDVLGMVVAHLAASQTEPVHCEHNHDNDTIMVWLGATRAVSLTIPNASISFDAASADGKLLGQVFAGAGWPAPSAPWAPVGTVADEPVPVSEFDEPHKFTGRTA